jgi:hypothetical protein
MNHMISSVLVSCLLAGNIFTAFVAQSLRLRSLSYGKGVREFCGGELRKLVGIVSTSGTQDMTYSLLIHHARLCSRPDIVQESLSIKSV